MQQNATALARMGARHGLARIGGWPAVPGPRGPLQWRWRRTRRTLHATLTRCRLTTIHPHISAHLPLCLHEKHTRWKPARAAVLQPCARHPASRERRPTGRPTRTASPAPCPPLTYRARGVPTAIQRPTPRRREVSSHKVRGTRSVPRGCPSHRRSARARDLAPASTGAVQPAYRASSVTSPQLDWGHPSRASREFCDLAPARLGPSVSR